MGINRHYSVVLALFAGSWIALACGVGTREDGGDAGDDTDTGIGGDLGEDSDGGDPGTNADDETSDGSGGGTETNDGGGTNTGTGGDGLDCGGKVYACTNGVDDDADGLVDLDDPECTGPCDDDEASFATGIPGDNVDCKQDCFFDGNSGQGDDGCLWDLKCDPANPGGNIGCEYTGGSSCPDTAEQDPDCVDFCSTWVPNGCDCFGCCGVTNDAGEEIWIFLNGNAECSLQNLDACDTCTPHIGDCGNDCDPAQCEICFGETEPPEGCDDSGCPEGKISCKESSDCPTGDYCVTGCCVPPPPV